MMLAAPAAAHATPARWQTLPLPPAMPTPTSSGLVDTGGAKLYYATFGTGAPVILLHGGMGNGDHWAFQVPALAKTHQVIAIDSRGQGRSTRGKASASYAAMAADVIAVMDHLKLDKAAIVGWSDGGAVALELGLQHPSRVTKLVVFGTNYDASGNKPRRGKPAPTFARYTTKCRADYQRLSKTPTEWRALVTWLTPLWRTKTLFTKAQLASINAPTLVALGAHDEIITRAHVEQMAKLIANARLVVLDDASHFALWQDPERFNKMLADFLVPTEGK